MGFLLIREGKWVSERQPIIGNLLYTYFLFNLAKFWSLSQGLMNLSDQVWIFTLYASD